MMCSGGLGSDNADVKLRQLQLCCRATVLPCYCATALLHHGAIVLGLSGLWYRPLLDRCQH